MAEKRNLTVLFAGLLLIICGATFLALNIWGVPPHWTMILKLLIPSLLILVGVFKLIRHFSWSEEELLNHPSKASLLGGIFWFSVGLVVLLDVLGTLESISFFGAYWPLILILYGMGKIIDYYRLRRSSRVRMGEIFGVVFLALFGWSVTKLSEAHLPLVLDLGLENLPWSVSLDSPVARHQFKVSETLDIEGVEHVEIRNLYGDVEVKTTEDDIASVDLLKIVREDSESAAEEIADQVLIVTDRKENTLYIRTNRDELGNKGKKLNSHLYLRLPESLQASVFNSYGNVSVEQRKGACQIDNSYGEIAVEGIVGNVVIQGRYEPIKATEIQGDLTITTRRAPVRVSDIVGDVKVSTNYNLVRAEDIRGNVTVGNRSGTIELEGISGTLDVDGKGSQVTVSEVAETVRIANSRKAVSVSGLRKDLTLDTAYSKVTALKVAGPVEIRAKHSEISADEIDEGLKLQAIGSEVSLSNVRGKLEIETTLRSVTIDDFSGPLSIQNEFGDISVAAAKDPAGPVSINNKNGQITITIPTGINCDLSAQTTGGEIISEFGPPSQKSEGRVSVLKTRVGMGGPQIELQTSHARIHIRKRG